MKTLALLLVLSTVHDYRVAHQEAILNELVAFLSIPNLASDTANIEKNAAAIQAMFARRAIESRLLRIAGAPPMVVADLHVWHPHHRVLCALRRR